jgi:hypothetical protein
MLRAAIVEVVAVDRGDDDMGQPHLHHGLGDVFRLVGVERGRDAGGDIAEGAGAGADLTHDHEGGVLLVPALADIGAAGLLAHGDELVRLHDLARLGIALRHRRAHADPVRLAQHLLIGLVSLFGVARPGLVEKVENRDHSWLSWAGLSWAGLS